ncbi:interleukin 21 receptor, tandem duplicate 1 [Brienomyrus brachyistius]|uniref:interleukin 21 receptor, tandem duplicate 1 n=1 Tax=Brienomyrus brachyistius TaxID=42636 RepID=UPI0020B1C260|nr:interleukin 21 receptor, tandem duplicate 1 [Brienomyrus brachyistius]
MAVLQRAILLFLLHCLLHNTACACNITCTADFISSLNCSCSEKALTSSYTVTAACWNEGENVNSSCEMTPSQHWCTTEPDFDLIVSVDANCSASVTKFNSKGLPESSSSVHFRMFERIKPEAPYDLHLEENDGGYNISWTTAYEDEDTYLHKHLIYRVRIRTTDQPFEERTYSIDEDRSYLEIPYELLRHGIEYEVDVQATVSPIYTEAFWSEWSSPMKWKANSNERNLYLYVVPFLSVLPCLLLIYLGRIGWLKWLHLYHYIPSPEEFFKPLYHIHHGDFQRWVGPTFTLSEPDTLERTIVLQVVKEKQQAPPEKLLEGGDEDTSQRGSEDRQDPGSGRASQSSSKHLLPGSSSQASTHMTGRISIHTVTVSGEENTGSVCPEAYRGSICTYLGDHAEVSLSHPGRAVMHRERFLPGPRSDEDEPIEEQAGAFGPYRLNWQLAEGDQELERLSLNSFSSNERSDDGYPHLELDLDTIDSGFQDSDCNSPVDTEINLKRPVLGEAGNLHSNYIRQWVTYSSASDATN